MKITCTSKERLMINAALKEFNIGAITWEIVDPHEGVIQKTEHGNLHYSNKELDAKIGALISLLGEDSAAYQSFAETDPFTRLEKDVTYKNMAKEYAVEILLKENVISLLKGEYPHMLAPALAELTDDTLALVTFEKYSNEIWDEYLKEKMKSIAGHIIEVRERYKS